MLDIKILISLKILPTQYTQYFMSRPTWSTKIIIHTPNISVLLWHANSKTGYTLDQYDYLTFYLQS